MRTKKAIINSSVNMIAFIIAVLPNFIIRKVFLDALGSDMVGLNALFTNIISWLSIAEMGIGVAIIYSLYKPYEEENYDVVRSYIKFYGETYRKIGFLMLIAGLTFTPFIGFFINGNVNLSVAKLAFILFLINSVISYWFSHKLCVLNVAQEAYKITIGTTISKLVIVIIQYIMLKVHPSFILFITIQLVINIVYFIIINVYTNQKHPWLRLETKNLDVVKRNKLLKNIKAMFMHKIGALAVNCTDNIVISKFVGLTELANYSNYNMIIGTFQSMIRQALTGLTASIGSMLVESTNEKAYETHKKMFFMNFWIISFLTISLYNTINQFIVLWVGEQYLLDNLTLNVLLINFYFFSMRGSVEQFQNASGKFYEDRYASIFEAVVNLISSLILVKYIGISGVFIGTLISNFTVIFWTKPYVVYKYVFEEKLYKYFIMYFKYLTLATIPFMITNYLTYSLKNIYDFKSFILNCLINIIVINIVYIMMFYRSNEFKYYKKLCLGFLKVNI